MSFRLPFFSKNVKPTVYFGVYITDIAVSAFVFRPDAGGTILAGETRTLPGGFDSLTEVLDNVITLLENATGAHLEESIYFLHSWMIDEETLEIREPYRGYLKKLSHDLKLKPLGYIDVKEAMLQHLRQKSIATALCVEINKTKLGVTLFHAGSVDFSQYVARSDNPSEDVMSVLLAMPRHAALPEEIVTYGVAEPSEANGAAAAGLFEHAVWDPSLYAHDPRVTPITEHELRESLACVVVSEVLGGAEAEQQTVHESHDDVAQTEDHPGEVRPLGAAHASVGPFGFVIGSDIAEITTHEAVEPEQPVADEPEPPEESYVISNDTVLPPEGSAPLEKSSRRSFRIPNIRSISLPQGMPIPLILGIGGGVLFFLLLFILEYFFHTIELSVSPRMESLKSSYTVAVPLGEDATNELIAMKNTSEQVFEDEIPTSGEREVGEKATGEVYVYNYDDSVRTFAKGTELRKDGMIFLLDAEVKIASSSGFGENQERIPQREKAKVTAKAIGPEYNLAKGTEFSIGSYSRALVRAVAETNFSGGSKKEIKTIARADLDLLKNRITTKAQQNSTDVLGAQSDDERIILSDLTSVQLGKTTYSGQVGDEAKTLKVTAQTAIEYYTVPREALRAKLLELIREELDEGVEIDASSLSFEIESVSGSKSEVELVTQVDTKTYRSPAIEKMQREVAFIPVGEVGNRMQKHGEIASVSVTKKPPFTLWTPFRAENISVTISLSE